jgi:hypothetical protein
MMRTLIALLMTTAALGCGGGGGGEISVPTPLAPGEVASITSCGGTTEPKGTCDINADNIIQVRVNTVTDRSCPCFNWSFLNQSLSDLGSPGSGGTTTYEFMGFRPGTYQVSGQTLNGRVNFTFWHNTSTSKIGVVPSSLQSLSGPSTTPDRACSVTYNPSSNQLPASFSFQFTIAAVTDGGTC